MKKKLRPSDGKPDMAFARCNPQISLEGIERDAALYPAHPRAPDFAKVKAANYVASQFADQAAKA